jgi:TolB-like protein/DNA-binding winged helix-turn-helix (wHTH) protein
VAGAFMVGEWTVLPELNSLECDGRTVHLEPKVMQVLVTLAEHPGHVASKEHIFHRVWPDTFVSDEVLTRSVSELRKVFEDNPQKPKYIQTIPKGGYRLVAPVVREPTKRADWLAGQWRKLVTVTAIIVLAVMASLYNMRAREHAASKAPITSLAVLPLKNISGDPSQEYFADGMTEEMISRLSMIRGLRVVSRTSVMQFKDTRIAVPQIARALGVDALVEGSVIRDSGRVRIHAQLIRGATDEHFWSETYDRELGDALALESDIAQAIAAKVQVTVTGEERERLVAARQVAPEVYESYLKGQGQSRTAGARLTSKRALHFSRMQFTRILRLRRLTWESPKPTIASARCFSPILRKKPVLRGWLQPERRWNSIRILPRPMSFWRPYIKESGAGAMPRPSLNGPFA